MKIDDVLKNIDVLHEYSLPSNLAWMRKVTQVESDSCFENLTKWAKSDFDKNSSYKGSLGDWIFKTRRNLFAYEYPESFEKEDGTKPDVIKSLSPLAAQYKTHWKIPAEFSCCPTEITCEPLKGYLEKLLPGNVFCRTQKYTSLVLEAALYKDKIIVKTQNKALYSIKPWAICIITFENNLFVHDTYLTCFQKDGADKFFLVLQDKNWTGGTVFDELCS